MVVGQLGKVTGTTVQGETLVDQMVSFTRGLNGTHLATLWVALGTLALILLIHFPPPEVARRPDRRRGRHGGLRVFDWGRLGVKAVGAVPDGIPVPSIPVLSVGELKAPLVVGLGVAVAASTATTCSLREASRRPHCPVSGRASGTWTHSPSSPRRRVCGRRLIGGFPCPSSGSRTALAIASGARTQIYSLAAAAVVVVVPSVAGPILRDAAVPPGPWCSMPQRNWSRCRSSGGCGLPSPRVRPRARDLFGTVFYGILAGVGTRSRCRCWRWASGWPDHTTRCWVACPAYAGMHDVTDYPGAQTLPGLIIYRFEAPFFANVGELRRRVQLCHRPRDRGLSRRTTRDGSCSTSRPTPRSTSPAADGLRELQGDLAAQGVLLGLVRLKRDLYEPLRRAGVVDPIGEGHAASRSRRGGGLRRVGQDSPRVVG